MAELKRLKVEPDFHDEDKDPLAELTRIMGLAPAEMSPAVDLDDDFGIDLERELLGDLASEMSSQAANSPEGLGEGAPVAGVADEAQSVAGEAERDADAAIAAELDSLIEDEIEAELAPFDGEFGAREAEARPSDAWAEPVPEEAVSEPAGALGPASPEELPVILDEDFLDMDFGVEEDPRAAEAFVAEPSSGFSPVEHADEAFAPAEAFDLPHAEDAVSDGLSLEDELSALLAETTQPVEAAVDGPVVPDEAEPVVEPAAYHDADQPGPDHTGDQLEVLVEAYGEDVGPYAADPHAADIAGAGHFDAAHDGVPHEDAPVADEYEEYSASVEEPMVIDAEEPVAVGNVAQEAPAVAERAFDPFAELAAMAASTAVRAASGYGSLTRKPERMAAQTDAEPAPGPAGEPVASESFDIVPDDDPLPDFEAAMAEEMLQSLEISEDEEATVAAFDEAVADDFAPAPVEFWQAEQPRTDLPEPSEWTARDAEMPGGVDEFVPSTEEQPLESSLRGHFGAPDVETVDVPEYGVEPAGELDIPDIAFEEDLPRAAPDDELDLQIASIFDDLGQDVADEEEPVEASPAAYAPSGHDRYYGAAAAGGTAVATAAAGRAFASAEDSPSGNDADDWLAGDLESFAISDTELAAGEFDVPDVPASGAEERGSGRRGLVVAGLVAGVAVLGGIGALAFSFGGGGDADAPPAVVRADPEPVKVRPEQPGGVTVPNQDKIVYERVAGGAGETAPSQEKLVSTSEEPVDIASRAPVREVLPAANDGEAPANEPSKAEDRILPDTDENAPSAAAPADVPSVTPRRVRTMIVKPDGTLVAREEPEPAPAMPESATAATFAGTATAASQADANALPGVEPLSGAAREAGEPAAGANGAQTPSTQAEVTAELRPGGTDGAAGEQTSAAEPSTPPARVVSTTTITPDSVPIAPTRPSDQPVEIVGTAAPQVAAATTSEWSMQIASQPTAEAAQASYANMTRQFGSVLNGRGVNIVRADIEGKGTYYRVRIPAESRSEAVSLCERFKAAGGNCFVAR